MRSYLKRWKIVSSNMLRFHISNITKRWSVAEEELITKILKELDLGHSLEDAIFRELREFKDVGNLLVAVEFGNFFGSRVKAVLSYIILDVYFYTYFLINVWGNYLNRLSEVRIKGRTEETIDENVEERTGVGKSLRERLGSLIFPKPKLKPRRKRLTIIVNESNLEGVKFPRNNFSATEGTFEVRIDPMQFTESIPKDLIDVDEEWREKFFSLFPYWKKLVNLAERLDRIPGDKEMIRISEHILRKLEIRVDTSIDRLIRKYVEVLWEIRRLCKREGEPFQLISFHPKDIV